jgi:Putative transposase/Transposase zinc-binding domain
MASSLQNIFNSHFESYSKEHHLHPRELRAAKAIMGCHSAALGGHVMSCPEGHESRVQYNACRHRSCPKCADRPRQEWLERELPKILPCEHFHVVFTLPHVFMALWEYNRARLNQLLFDCARLSLLALCADERFLGATPGILMSLHTWGRTLSHHPHVHCLVSAGGIDDAGTWHTTREKYLVPVKALSALFRGKMLHELKRLIMDRRLTLPVEQNREHWQQAISGQYRRHWNVSISEPYAHGRGVALYLARYVKGGPLSKERALHMKAGQVSFGYTDHL